jgi:hypothetical protein
MRTIEFQTYIDHGQIEVPAEFQDVVRGRARVIILADESDETSDMIDFLLQHPYQAAEFTPLTRDEIYERG